MREGMDWDACHVELSLVILTRVVAHKRDPRVQLRLPEDEIVVSPPLLNR